ncbi:MAG: NrpR regulatory domain-containing protein, partial [Dehalococcoidia bacterium]|nr:NrpR regulatory domain-containing protein [Dehalococcoidia bacterium]
MTGVFHAALSSSSLVALAGEGNNFGGIVVPAGQVGLATVCNVAVNGCLLKSGIPVYARFGGLLQIKEGQPFRFVDLIEFTGSTIDPFDIFIAGRMTDVIQATTGGNGKVLAGYCEIPMLSYNKADELLQRMNNSGLVTRAFLARPGEKICDIPFNPEKAGLVSLSGLNAAAAVTENGTAVSTHSMCGLLDVSRLRPFVELL